MSIPFGEEPCAIFLPDAGSVLTDAEISRRLSISEEAARALITAAFPSLLASERTKQSTYP
jgi:hypothetical protein